MPHQARQRDRHDCEGLSIPMPSSDVWVPLSCGPPSAPRLHFLTRAVSPASGGRPLGPGWPSALPMPHATCREIRRNGGPRQPWAALRLCLGQVRASAILLRSPHSPVRPSSNVSLPGSPLQILHTRPRVLSCSRLWAPKNCPHPGIGVSAPRCDCVCAGSMLTPSPSHSQHRDAAWPNTPAPPTVTYVSYRRN